MTGRWLLPAGDTGTPAWTVHRHDTGPETVINLGPGIAPVLSFRDLADLDDLAAVLAAARDAHAAAQARHAAAPLVAEDPMHAGGELERRDDTWAASLPDWDPASGEPPLPELPRRDQPHDCPPCQFGNHDVGECYGPPCACAERGHAETQAAT